MADKPAEEKYDDAYKLIIGFSPGKGCRVLFEPENLCQRIDLIGSMIWQAQIVLMLSLLRSGAKLEESKQPPEIAEYIKASASSTGTPNAPVPR
jgi:hypothetical protein